MATLLGRYRTYLRRKGLAASTIDRYLTDLKAFERWLDGCPWAEVTPDLIELFLDQRRVSRRTRYRWISEIHSLYSWAVTRREVPVDPTVMIDRPRLHRLLPRPIDDDDLATAIDQAGPMMRAWLCLAAYGGLRCAEIASLDRAGLQPHTMRVIGKGGTERVVPLHPKLKEALAGVNLARSGPVFRTKTGKPFSPKAISRRVAHYLEAIGVDATAHQARHSFGSRAYRASRNLRAVQELMGHADPSTTAGYAAVTADDLAGVVEALPDL